MIVVDSSVWIDYLNGKENNKTKLLDSSLDNELICIGDIILLEVLQGIKSDSEFNAVKTAFNIFPYFDMVGKTIAYKAAENYRYLRRKGVTVRKSVDMIIGTYCLENGIALLHNDKDFDLMEKHLGLKTVK